MPVSSAASSPGYQEIFADGVAGDPAPGWLLDAAGERWDVGPQDARLITVSENAMYALEAGAGSYVLRLSRPQYAAGAAHIRSELAWMRAVAEETEVSVPPVVTGRDGGLDQEVTDPWGASWAVMLMGRVPGEVLAGRADPGPYYQQIGAIAARLHAHARQWRRPREFERFTWEADDLVGPRARWGYWRRADLTPAGERLLEQLQASARADLARHASRDRSWGLIHADLHAGNLMADGSALTVIDFDDSGFGYYMFDFAASVDLVEHRSGAPAKALDWMRGYESVSPLSEADKVAACALSALRRIASLGWLATHRADAREGITTLAEHTEGTLAIADRYASSPTWLLEDGL